MYPETTVQLVIQEKYIWIPDLLIGLCALIAVFLVLYTAVTLFSNLLLAGWIIGKQIKDMLLYVYRGYKTLCYMVFVYQKHFFEDDAYNFCLFWHRVFFKFKKTVRHKYDKPRKVKLNPTRPAALYNAYALRLGYHP